MRRAHGLSLLFTAIALLVAVALPVGAHPAADPDDGKSKSGLTS